VTNTKESVERRKHARFKVQSGAYAAVGPSFDQVGPLMDIGMGGLSFRYTAREKQPSGLSLDIIFTNSSFRLDYILFKAVSDLEISDTEPLDVASKRRTSVRFEKLTPYQELILSHFIQSHYRGVE
jgi:hypothetical protein